MITSFKTKKETVLPIMNLKGKPYLQVAHRIQWFREECPEHRLENTVQVNDHGCLAECKIYDAKDRMISNAHKAESKKNKDFIEKAQTGAIGRALSYIGYGTQFCGDELDEGDRLADSPIGYGSNKSGNPPATQPNPSEIPNRAAHIGGQNFSKDDYKNWVFPPKKDGSPGKFTDLTIPEAVGQVGIEDFTSYVNNYYKSAKPRLAKYLEDIGEDVPQDEIPPPEYPREPEFQEYM